MLLKFVFSKKAKKIDEIFTVDLTVCSKCQIDGEDLVDFCGFFRKHELYHPLDLKFVNDSTGKKYLINRTLL